MIGPVQPTFMFAAGDSAGTAAEAGSLTPEVRLAHSLPECRLRHDALRSFTRAGDRP
jgi:hypothetical protein